MLQLTGHLFLAGLQSFACLGADLLTLLIGGDVWIRLGWNDCRCGIAGACATFLWSDFTGLIFGFYVQFGIANLACYSLAIVLIDFQAGVFGTGCCLLILDFLIGFDIVGAPYVS